MSSSEGIERTPNLPRRSYALFLIAIIALSSLTVVLFLQNQSLQKDSENTTLTQLAWMAEDVSRRVHVFTSEYDKEIWDYTLTTGSSPENATKAHAIDQLCQTINDVAEQAYYDLQVDLRRIEYLDDETNRATYQNISETLRVALGQVDQLMRTYIYGRPDSAALDVPILLWQLYNLTGLNSNRWNIGLNGIAYSFSLLSAWWQAGAYGQSPGWFPPPQTSLSFALGNATELYGQLTAWSSYRNPDSVFS